MHFRLKNIIIVMEWSHQNARSVVITILVRANSRQNTPSIFNNDTGKQVSGVNSRQNTPSVFNNDTGKQP